MRRLHQVVVLFVKQGGLIVRQNLPIRVSRTTCCAISTKLPSGWFYQDHRGSFINKAVVLINKSGVLHKQWSELCDFENMFSRWTHLFFLFKIRTHKSNQNIKHMCFYSHSLRLFDLSPWHWVLLLRNTHSKHFQDGRKSYLGLSWSDSGQTVIPEGGDTESRCRPLPTQCQLCIEARNAQYFTK